MFESTKELKRKYDERLLSLQEAKKALEDEHDELAAEYESKLELDALGVEEFENEALLGNAIEEVKKAIAGIDERISIVVKGRKQALVNNLPVLRKNAEASKNELIDEMNEAVDELQRMKAEMLLHILSMYEIRQRAHKLNADFNTLASDVEGVKRGDVIAGGMFGAFESLPLDPNPSFFGDDVALQKAIGCPVWATKNAIAGRVPKWVTRYATTGVIDFDAK